MVISGAHAVLLPQRFSAWARFMPRITPVPYRLLVRVFELEGFTVKRQKGDHLIMTKPGVKRPLVIKTSPGEVPVTHILTNLRTAGISRERYLELLSQVK
ncbi:type II toxin-antitoxin system HicA family toxin [Methanothrix sp.]|uniref:type II toxin-antitoxin system HicA family toxin n=1 Tax=Methanothrix sp. TaxID=90426 RepID=UPI0034E2976B